MWNLSERNEIGTLKHLVGKWTLNHLGELAKWLSCVVRTSMSAGIDSMLLSYQSESTLYSLPESQGTPCPKQESYTKLSDRNKIEHALKNLDKVAKWLSVLWKH